MTASSAPVVRRGALHPAVRVVLYLLALGLSGILVAIVASFARRELRALEALLVSRPFCLADPESILCQAPWIFVLVALGLAVQVAIEVDALLHAAFIVVAILVTYIFRRWLDRRSFGSLGLQTRPGWWAEALSGFGLGALLMSLILVVELALGGYHVVGWAREPTGLLLARLVVWFIGFVAVAFYEELLARGYILQNLAAAWGRPIAVLLSSAVFALAHAANPGSGGVALFGIFCAGLLLAAGYLTTGRLWLPIGLHLSWNFFQGPLFGFPVSGMPAASLLELREVGPDLLSGGAFGPEASLIGVVAEVVGLGLLLGWRRRAGPRATAEQRPD